MVCHCPPRFCYFRPDCRHPQRRERPVFLARAKKVEAAARSNLAALGDIWLYERREELQQDLAEDHWSNVTRRAKEDALARIEAIIERKERGSARG